MSLCETNTICVSGLSKKSLIDLLVEYDIIDYKDDYNYTLCEKFKIVYCGNLSGCGHDEIPLILFLLELKQRYPDNIIFVAGKGDLFKLGLHVELNKQVISCEPQKSELTKERKTVGSTKAEATTSSLTKSKNRSNISSDILRNLNFLPSDTRYERLYKILSNVCGNSNAIKNRVEFLGTSDQDAIVDSYIEMIKPVSETGSEITGILRKYLDQSCYCYVDGNTVYTDFTEYDIESCSRNNTSQEFLKVFQNVTDKVREFIERRKSLSDAYYNSEIELDSQLFVRLRESDIPLFINHFNYIRFVSEVPTCLFFNLFTDIIYFITTGVFCGDYPVRRVIENKIIFYINLESNKLLRNAFILKCGSDLCYVCVTTKNIDFINFVSEYEVVKQGRDVWILGHQEDGKYHYSSFSENGTLMTRTEKKKLENELSVKLTKSQERKIAMSPGKKTKRDSEDIESKPLYSPKRNLYSRSGRSSVKSPTSSPKRTQFYDEPQMITESDNESSESDFN